VWSWLYSQLSYPTHTPNAGNTGVNRDKPIFLDRGNDEHHVTAYGVDAAKEWRRMEKDKAKTAAVRAAAVQVAAAQEGGMEAAVQEGGKRRKRRAVPNAQSKVRPLPSLPPSLFPSLPPSFPLASLIAYATNISLHRHTYHLPNSMHAPSSRTKKSRASSSKPSSRRRSIWRQWRRRRKRGPGWGKTFPFLSLPSMVYLDCGGGGEGGGGEGG
jgi:hypothetical protein